MGKLFQRFGKLYENLAKDGHFLLAERLHDDSNKLIVWETLEQQLHVKLCMDDMYKLVISSTILLHIFWSSFLL